MNNILLTVKPLYVLELSSTKEVVVCLSPTEAKKALESLMDQIAKQMIKD